MNKSAHQEEALRLRKEERMSLNEIADALGISKSSASLWLRDHPLTPEELELRKEKQIGKSRRVKKSKEELDAQRPHYKTLGLPPKRIGEISEAVVAAEFVKRDFDVLRPMGDSLRYDMAIDYEGVVYRIQVKTVRTDGLVLIGKTVSTDGLKAMKGLRSSRNYVGQIDWFAFYSPELDQVFMMHVNDAPESAVTLRLTESMTKTNCRMAKDFLLDGSWRPDQGPVGKPEEPVLESKSKSEGPQERSNKAIHGSACMYSYHKCRCDVCKTAHNLRMKEYMRSRREKKSLTGSSV